MGNLKIAALALTAALGASMLAGTASAMPMNDLSSAAAQLGDSVQDVRWVCGPYRCGWDGQGPPHWHRPYYPPYGYWYGQRHWDWDWHHWGMHPWGWGW